MLRALEMRPAGVEKVDEGMSQSSE